LATSGSSTEVDAVVVGGGVAGLASALWLARYRRSVVVLDSGDYRAAKVEASHGYLGRDPQTPLELLERGREEVLRYPIATLVQGRAESVVRRADGRFDVGSLVAHRVVLACGVFDVKPELQGFDEHYGGSLFHCPACDGYEAATGTSWPWGGTPTSSASPARCSTGLARSPSSPTDTTSTATRAAAHCWPATTSSWSRRMPCACSARVGPWRAYACSRDDCSPPRWCSSPSPTSRGPSWQRPWAAGSTKRDTSSSTPRDRRGAGRLRRRGPRLGLQLVQVAASSGAVAGVGATQSLFGTPGAPSSPTPAPELTS